MNILLIHQAFTSPKEAGGTRHFEFARYITKKGDKFTIVASNLSYFSGKENIKRGGLWTRENIEGVKVIRSYTYPSLHRSFAWRVLSFISFMVSSALASLCEKNIDLVIGTTPPIFQAGSAYFVAAIKRCPFLLEVRDLWPEFAIDLGILSNPFLIYLSRSFERFLYRKATHLVVNSPAYQDYLVNKGVPKEKITLIPNGVDADMFDPHDSGKELREKLGLTGKFIITYAGALGMANDIDTILRAADRLKDEANIHFLLVGDGKERRNLEIKAKALDLFNLTFIGTYPKSKIKDLLAASDACIATLLDIPMFKTTYPNKVFDYMAAARPVVLCIDGVIRKVIDKAKAGIFVPPGDDKGIAHVVHDLYKNPEKSKSMGMAGRLYVKEHFDRSKHAEDLLSLLKRLYKKKDKNRARLYGKIFKPFFDLFFAILLLIFFSPLIFLLAILVRERLGTPIFFNQRRPGLNGKPFSLYKFRTMTNACDREGNLLSDSERLNSFGRLLRSTSLDELPELFNVLMGDMSLVGPRPLLMRYLKRYTKEQMRRHEVKPGITGWAQVKGRNAICWEDKFKFDIWYVDHYNFCLDLKIVILTVWKIFKREGISKPGHASMPEFLGNDS